MPVMSVWMWRRIVPLHTVYSSSSKNMNPVYRLIIQKCACSKYSPSAGDLCHTSCLFTVDLYLAGQARRSRRIGFHLFLFTRSCCYRDCLGPQRLFAGPPEHAWMRQRGANSCFLNIGTEYVPGSNETIPLSLRSTNHKYIRVCIQPTTGKIVMMHS